MEAPTPSRSAATSAVSAHAPAGTNAAGESVPPVPKMSFLVTPPPGDVSVDPTGTVTVGRGDERGEEVVDSTVESSSPAMGLGSRGARTPPTGRAAGICVCPVFATASSSSTSSTSIDGVGYDAASFVDAASEGASASWYSTPHTAATFAASNAGSSHHAALLGDASHVPHTNSTALVSVDLSPVGGGTTLRNVFAGSLTPLRTTHISSGDVGDLLRHTASPAPSLAISAALVTGTAAPAPLVPTPGNDPTPDDWDPDDWDPAQHVTSFRPGLRTWLPMGCPLSNRTSHRPVGSAYVSPAATAASSCSSEHDGLAIMNANSSPGASASVTCSKMERWPGSAGVMSARWVHAGLNPSSPSLRFPDRIPHGAPPGQPTSHTLHTGHGAWFCRMIGGMPHTLTRNASVSVFVCVPVSEASISA